MFHLRLKRALSYDNGVISATSERPDVYTEDEVVAESAVESGYFKLISAPETEYVPEEVPEEESAEEPETEYVPGPKPLEQMTGAELDTFATSRNISLKGCKNKAAKIAKIREILSEEELSGDIEYGSPTMIELQSE